LIDAMNSSRGLAVAKTEAIDNLTAANRKRRSQPVAGQ
jgi:hypothetical protein